MIALSRDEALAILEKEGVNNLSVKNNEFALKKRIPSDSGMKNYIAKALSNIDFEENAVLFIDEYGIWPSSENMDLYNGYIKSLGIHESLEKKPAYLINEKERVELYCILGMILYFSWDAVFVTNFGSEVIHISHDEYLTVQINRKSETNIKTISCVNAIFERLDLFNNLVGY